MQAQIKSAKIFKKHKYGSVFFFFFVMHDWQLFQFSNATGLIPDKINQWTGQWRDPLSSLCPWVGHLTEGLSFPGWLSLQSVHSKFTLWEKCMLMNVAFLTAWIHFPVVDIKCTISQFRSARVFNTPYTLITRKQSIKTQLTLATLEGQGLIIRQEQAFWVSGASIINRQ